MSVFWERGSPDLPACGPWHGSPAAFYGPSSPVNTQDPREGPSLTRRTTQDLPSVVELISGWCRHPGNGGTQTCLPAAQGVAHLHQQPLKILARGQVSRGGRRKTSLGAASLGLLPRSGDIKARGTSRGSRDVSYDNQGQAGASGRREPVSSLVLKGQA